MTAIAREQQRLIALAKSGLSSLASVGVFETAAREIVAGLEVAIGAIGSIDSDSVIYQGVVKATHVGQTFFSRERNFSRKQLPCDVLLDRNETLCIPDLARDSDFEDAPALMEFGIRAYLGVPLRNAAGDCLGAIEAIDLAPRYFSPRDIQLLELIARNLALELERAPDLEFLASERPTSTFALSIQASDRRLRRTSFDRLRTDFIDRLVQDLRTPLTSVLGMTSVLNQEIYGELRPKQKEYLGIVHDSGQQMLGVVDSLISLQELGGRDASLSITTVNVSSLCQQLTNRLRPEAERRSCQLDISLELEEMNWPLDRLKVELALFYLLVQTLDASDEGCTLRLDVRIHQGELRFEVWVAHPWLGDSLPTRVLNLCGLEDDEDVTEDLGSSDPIFLDDSGDLENLETPDPIFIAASPVEVELLPHLESQPAVDAKHLGLLLSCHLLAQHGGRVAIFGCARSGYRYTLSLPGNI